MKFRLFSITVFLINGARLFAQSPVINSFSPASGPVGTVVTISGTGFSPTLAGNTVYLGEVRANIVTASATSISVTAPVAATYSPISVTANNLTAYSSNPFVLTFEKGYVDESSFSAAQVDSIDNSTGELFNGDLDGDGKLDLLVFNSVSGIFSVFKNTGTAGSYSFAPKQDVTLPLAPNENCYHAFKVYDMDGDGKKDIVSFLNGCDSIFSIFKNTSTAGSISFAPKKDFPLIKRSGTADFAIADMDADGKPDLISLKPDSSIVTIFLNTGVPGNFSFAPGLELRTSGIVGAIGSHQIIATDFNGDGKPELVITQFDYNYNGYVSFYTNSSLPGTIAFSAAAYIPTDIGAYWLNPGDVDGDGKTDLLITSSDFGTRNLSVFRNTSTADIVSFAPQVDYRELEPDPVVMLTDMNGDGKPDVVQKVQDSLFIRVNNSVIGKVDFSKKVAYYMPAPYFQVGDLNGDSLPDISSAGNQVIIYKHLAKKIYITSFTPVSGADGTSVSIKGAGFSGATSVMFGGIASSSFTVTADSLVTAVVGSGKTGKVTVSSPLGTAVSIDSFFMAVAPTLLSFSKDSATTGDSVLIYGNNLFRVNVVSFGGVSASLVKVTSDTSLIAVVGSGASGSVAIANPYGNASLAGFYFIQPAPYPGSIFVTPTKGPVGSLVTITSGNNNFSPDLPYTVYFGSVKAVVVSVTPSSMVVKVPPGINYRPVSVTTNKGLTSYSKLPFIVTFSGADILSNSFDTAITYTRGTNGTRITTGDFDGDGKPDIAVASIGVSVLKNTSTRGLISFQSPVDFAGTGNQYDIIATDVDGDGKLDIVTANFINNSILVYRNISTTGNVAFANKLEFAVGERPVNLAAGDLNGDGKPDIAVANRSELAASILKNTSTPGNISFAPQIKYTTPGYCQFLAISDIDGDNRLDLVLNVSSAVEVVRNTSISDSITFSGTVYPVKSGFVQNFKFSLADLDADNRPDIVLSASYPYTVSSFRNTSTVGNPAFVAQPDYALTNGTELTYAADINGDGKPDLIFPTLTTISTLQNNSPTGSIAFSNLVDKTATRAVTAFGADIDLDGKPDMLMVDDNGIYIYRNKNGETDSLVLCPPIANASITSTITGANYQWQADTGSGFANLSDNTNYSGTHSLTLLLHNAPSGWYGYKYKCLVNGNTSSDITKLKFENNWAGTNNNLWENTANWSCGVLPDDNTDVIVSNGNITINSNVTIRSLKIEPGATVTVTTGYHLTILY